MGILENTSGVLQLGNLSWIIIVMNLPNCRTYPWLIQCLDLLLQSTPPYFFTQQLHTISAAVCFKLKNQTDTDFDAGYGTDSGSKYTSSSTNKSDICGRAGWSCIAYLDMTDPNTTCLSGWKLTTYSKRTCGRVYSLRYTCDAVIFPVSAREYSRVCGRIKAYLYGYTVAFHNSSIDTAYLSGVSITHGYPREHIWSFAAGKSELDHDRYVCPCEDNKNRSVPLLVRTTSEAL